MPRVNEFIDIPNATDETYEVTDAYLDEIFNYTSAATIRCIVLNEDGEEVLHKDYVFEKDNRSISQQIADETGNNTESAGLQQIDTLSVTQNSKLRKNGLLGDPYSNAVHNLTIHYITESGITLATDSVQSFEENTAFN